MEVFKCFILNSSSSKKLISKYLSLRYVKHLMSSSKAPLLQHNMACGFCSFNGASQRIQKLPNRVLCSQMLQREVYSDRCGIKSTKKTLNETGYSGPYHRSISTRQIFEKGELLSDGALACRLANENGYLSWCRNSYLITAVAIAMLFQGHNHATDLAGYGCMLIGGLNITWGSIVYIYNLVAHRKRIQMSIPLVLFTVAGVMLNLLLFLAVLIVFTADCDPSVMLHRRLSTPEGDKEVYVLPESN